MSQGLIRNCAMLFFAAIVIPLSASQASAQGIPMLGTEDTAIAIDMDLVPAMNNGRYPSAENPPKAIDGIIAGSKYLNFGNVGSGFIVSPILTGIPVDGFQITTGNDAPARDPASYELYGFNGLLTTMDSGPSPAINQTGLAEAWTLISSGALSLPGDPAINTDQRGVAAPVVTVGSTTGYQHYKMIFPTIKAPNISNIMQFAEIEFFADANDLNSGFLNADPIIAVDQTPSPGGFSSSYPSGEAPAFGIDQRVDPVTMVPNSKYLNFGEERSGIIITNSSGAFAVQTLGLTTANDAVERDPTTYELYGTNDPITSADNSNSNGTEVWTLLSSGPTNLPGVLPNGGGDDFRLTQQLIPINATTAYSSYRLIFPTVKDAAGANSMQIEDIQLYAIPEPSTWALLALGGLAAAGIARRRRK